MQEEANYLVFGCLNLPVDESVNAFLDAKLTTSEMDQILQALYLRIQKRIPSAYITNHATFGDFTFYVDKRVLIPRSLIAELLDADKIDPFLQKANVSSVNRILDLGTGSGCLAILLAYAYPDAVVDAVDISQDALDVAAVNVTNYGLQDRVNLIQSDLFNNLAGKKYDLIISNPPYVTQENMNQLPPEFRIEPSIALDGGVDGLKYVKQIIERAEDYMNENALLVVEAGRSQKQAIQSLYPKHNFGWLATSVGDEDVFALPSSSYRRRL